MLETLHNLEEIANIDSEILEESEPISEPEVIAEPEVIVEPEPIEEPEPEVVPKNPGYAEPKQIVIEPEPKKVIEVEEKSYDMPKFVPVAGPAPIKKPVPKSQNEEKSLLEKISANQTNTSLHDAISSKKEIWVIIIFRVLKFLKLQKPLISVNNQSFKTIYLEAIRNTMRSRLICWK